MHQINEQLFSKVLDGMAEIQNNSNSIIQEGIEKYGVVNLPSVDELGADRNIVLKAVKKNGGALEFADGSLRNDASFFWHIWNIQKSETGDDYRKAYINQYLLKETAKILLGAGLTIFSSLLFNGACALGCVVTTLTLFQELVFLISIPATYIGAIYTFYKVAEHGYGFFKAKYELSTSKTEHVSAL